VAELETIGYTAAALLAAAMAEHGLAVHEEFVLVDLLADLGMHPRH
jgi:hypothetical protein